MPPQTPEYVYVTNQGGNSVSAFQIDSTGQLHEIAGSPYKLPFSPLDEGLISDPKSRFLLVHVSSGIASSVYVPAAITSSHSLTFASTQVPGGFTVMDPLGRFFFDTDGNIVVNTPIHVDSITSDLSFPEVPGSPFEPGIEPAAIDPAGKFLFGFPQMSPTIVTLQIGATGTLTNGTTAPVLYGPIYGYTSGAYLYVQGIPAGNTNGELDTHVYKINSGGTVTETASQPNLGSFFVAFSPSGNFVLTPNNCTPGCELDTLAIDNSSGSINPTPTFRYAEHWTAFPALDSSGSHLFAVSSGSDCTAPGTLSVFKVSTSGQLGATGATALTGPWPAAIVVTQ